MCAHTIAPHGRPSSVAQLGVADLDRVAALIYLGEELRRPLRRPESLDRVLSGDQDHAPLRAVARVEVLLLPPSAGLQNATPKGCGPAGPPRGWDTNEDFWRAYIAAGFNTFVYEHATRDEA